MDFTICTILLTALFYWPPKLVLSLSLTRRVDKSLHFHFAQGLETKSFLVALLLVLGFGYGPQNRLDESGFSLQSAKCATF